MAQSLNFDPTAILYIVLGLSMIGYCVYRLIKNNAQRKGDKGEDKRTGNYDKLLMSLIEGARQFQVDGLAVEVRNCY
ncbi:MAG: hypothetical protein FWE66_05310, partial [Oscillospiraceae bacterium]|nr:hypothetical protein [Oscillospiraceae bacterium]